jgi:hypothetical protein
MWKVREQMVKSLIVRISADDLTLAHVDELEALFADARGHCKLYFDLTSASDPRPRRILCRSVVVEPNQDVMNGLGRMFGRRALAVEGD